MPPRRGSLAFRPRKRARRFVPRIRAWPKMAKAIPLGFPTYKVGMRRAGLIEYAGPAKGLEVAVPITVLEAPPITIFGIRAYESKITGDVAIGDVIQADQKVLGKLKMKKGVERKGIDWLESPEIKDRLSHLSLLAVTNPELAGLPKKKCEIVEIAIGGDLPRQLEFAKEVAGKSIRVDNVFAEGEWVDAIAVTKGKGWAGVIKRFGVAKQRRKATGRVRHLGTLGPWHPPYVMYTTPQAGQLGLFRRTQYNNKILAIGHDPAEINPPGGFPHYGLVRSDYVIVRGSIPGPAKRFVFLRKGIRAPPIPPRKPELMWIR